MREMVDGGKLNEINVVVSSSVGGVVSSKTTTHRKE